MSSAVIRRGPDQARPWTEAAESPFRGCARKQSLPCWWNPMVDRKHWTCVEVSCDGDASEDLAVLIAEAFGVGVEITDGGIRFYLGEEWSTAMWEPVLLGVLERGAAMGGDRAPRHYTSRSMPDANWANEWKKHFKPLRVGSHFVICPTWEPYGPLPLDRVLLMDPGMAFGTGHHETTRLCLEWLEGFSGMEGLNKRGTVLDVGTGSGILAVAAALVGHPAVVGLDNDPEAIEVARESVRINGVGDRVALVSGTTADIWEAFDIVMANIQSGPLIQMAAELVRCTGNRGRLVLSGILLEQMDEVKRAYADCGMSFKESRAAGEWGLLVFEK